LIQEHQGHKRILSPKRRFDITKNVEVEYKGEMRKFRGELRPLNATELNINSVNKNEIIKEKITKDNSFCLLEVYSTNNLFFKGMNKSNTNKKLDISSKVVSFDIFSNKKSSPLNLYKNEKLNENQIIPIINLRKQPFFENQIHKVHNFTLSNNINNKTISKKIIFNVSKEKKNLV